MIPMSNLPQQRGEADPADVAEQQRSADPDDLTEQAGFAVPEEVDEADAIEQQLDAALDDEDGREE
jgi:predicted lipoprotein